jgi:hypothetical protein
VKQKSPADEAGQERRSRVRENQLGPITVCCWSARAPLPRLHSPSQRAGDGRQVECSSERLTWSRAPLRPRGFSRRLWRKCHDGAFMPMRLARGFTLPNIVSECSLCCQHFRCASEESIDCALVQPINLGVFHNVSFIGKFCRFPDCAPRGLIPWQVGDARHLSQRPIIRPTKA